MATYFVQTAAQLQTALDIVIADDIISLDYTRTFIGNFTSRNRGVIPAGHEIIIRSSALDANLPADGIRITPAFAAFLPKIQALTGDPPWRFGTASNCYIFKFLEFVGTSNGAHIQIYCGANDTEQTLLSQQPYNITFDRLYMHGSRLTRQKTGISLNGKDLNVINSYFSNYGGVGQDTKPIEINNGEGPHLIQNNYLHAGAYGIMTGGSDVPIRTAATVLASPAPTTDSATVDSIVDLRVGQLVAILYADELGVLRRAHPRVTNINAATNRITYPDIGFLPVIPGDIRWGAQATGITFRHNHVTRPTTDRDALLPNPPVLNTPTTSASATGLAAGTWYVRIHAYGDNIGYSNSDLWTPVGIERTVVLGAQSTIGLAWPAIADVTHYRAWVYQKDVNGAITNGRWFETTGLSLTITNAPGTAFTTISNSGGTKLVVKNFFELKHGVDVICEANIFENSWMGADNGGAVWLKSNNQSGNHEFAEVGNVLFVNNVFRHLEGFASISGQRISPGQTVADYPAPVHGIYWRNNLCYDSQGVRVDANGNVTATSRFCDLAQGVYDVEFDHNTIIHRTHGNFLLTFPNTSTDNLDDLRLTNNLWFHNSFGIFGAGGSGKIALDGAIPNGNYNYDHNAMGGATASQYNWPGKINYSPTTATLEAQFKNYGGPNIADYKLKRLAEGDSIDSLYLNAGLDGEDLGADIDAILLAITGVIEGNPVEEEEEEEEPPTPPVDTTSIRRRDFTKNVANYMSLGVAGLGAILNGRSRFSMLAKVRPDTIDTSAGANDIISVVHNTTFAGAVLAIDGPTGRIQMVGRSVAGEASKTLVGGTVVSLGGAVQYLGGVWDITGDVMRAYLNGTADGVLNPAAFTNAQWTLGAPDIPDVIGGFRAPPTTTAVQFDGQIYYVAIWSDELTPTQWATLATGVSPLDVSPETLIYYQPMTGAVSPEVPVVPVAGTPLATITGSIPGLIDVGISGVQAQGQIESVSAEGANSRALTGVFATGAVGSVSVGATAALALTGVAATCAVGTVTPQILIPAPIVATHGTIEMELNGRGNGWTVVTDWNRVQGVRWTRGLPGNAVSDCVAEPGVLSFVLDNSERNSAGLLGYYSPDHVNCRAGFQTGIGVRYKVGTFIDVSDFGAIRFTGTLDLIDPVPGVNGPRTVRCEVVDWLARAQTTRLPSIPVATNIRGDQAFNTVIEALTPVTRPTQIEFDLSPDVFPYVFDRSRDERTTVYDELYRIAASGLNMTWIRGDGTLVYEARSRRAANAVSVDSFVDHHGFSATRDRSTLVNQVQATIHPRDARLVESVLYSLTEPIPISSGGSVTLLAPWTDEANPDIRVGALSLTPPEPVVDYQAYSEIPAEEVGFEITPYLVVESTVSGNATIFTVSLNGPFNGYITRLRQRGFPLYDYGATVLQSEDAASIDKRGLATSQIDLQYQASANFGLEVAQYIVYSRSNPVTTISGFTRIVAVSNTVEMERSLRREISDRVSILDPLTGINQPFFINRIEETEIEGIIRTQWTLIPADTSSYWQLDVDGKSEMDFTTKLSFGLIIGHSDAPHADVHTDSPHLDTAHGDTAHADAAHSDAVNAHGDTAHDDAHGDVAHSDLSHIDTPHQDNHADIAHTDVHDDVPHADVEILAHSDIFETEYLHFDSPHQDGAVSYPHEDTHNDLVHFDRAHSDIGSNSHGDSDHVDVPAGHADAGHGDTAHADSNHSDVLHTDVHQDTVHLDTNW